MKLDIPKLIKGNDFATYVAILSVILQSGHTFKAYLSTEALNPNWVDYSFAVLAAIVIDLAILFYTLRNRKDIALGAMFVMMAINGYAYWIIHQQLNIAFWAGMFFSAVIPISVFYYSEEIKITRVKRIHKELQ